MSADPKSIRNLSKDISDDYVKKIWAGKMDNPDDQARQMYSMIESIVLATGRPEIFEQAAEHLCEFQYQVMERFLQMVRSRPGVVPAACVPSDVDAEIAAALHEPAVAELPGGGVDLGCCAVCSDPFRMTGAGTMEDPKRLPPMVLVHPECVKRP
jgi:hypothetical protein